MKIIRTVKGDISKEQLGWCQCHEHVFLSDGPSRKVSKALFMDDYDKSLREIISYKKAGGKSFVDAQPFGCGRMIEKLYRASKDSDVNIITCTGFHKTVFFEDQEWLKKQDEQTLSDIFINEVESGVQIDNGIFIKTGIIKCSAVPGEHKADSLYEKLFLAAVNAAKVTNAPVLIHMDPGANAFPILKLFEENGIPSDRIMFCHLDRAKYDFAYHEELAQAGVFLDYDTIHRLKYHSDEKELRLIEHMTDRGFGDNLVLSLDTTNERLKTYGAKFGLDYILTEFGSRIIETLGQGILNKFMIDNPAEFLSFELE